MKTDRDAWWALGLLAGFPALLLLALFAIGAATGEAIDPQEAALVVAVGWVWIIPMALWQTRRPVVAHGVHAVRRRGREMAGLLALLMVLQRPPDDASLAQALWGWAVFGGVIMVLFGHHALGFWRRLWQRPSALRKMLRGPVLLAGVNFIIGFQLGHLSGATPAQAVWHALVWSGVSANFTFPWRFPRTGATPVGRRVLLLGEFLSMAAFAFVIAMFTRGDGAMLYSMIGSFLVAMIGTSLWVRLAWPNSPRRDLR
jgi:hypothetical protein